MKVQIYKDNKRPYIAIARLFLPVSLLLLTILFSCRKFVEVKTSRTELLETVVFDNDLSAISAVAGLYVKMNEATFNIFCGGTSVFTGLSSDEIINSTTNATYDPFSKNSLASTNSTVNSRFWSRVYPIIYQANAIIDGLNQTNRIADSLKNELIGEAKLVRAFAYFNMVNLFGDVPLVVSTDYRINSIMPRMPVALIYQQIVQDLNDAQTTVSPATISGRPNKWAAKALLARVYLYLKNYTEAENQSSSLINSGVFSLVSNLNAVFLENSTETIWQIMPVGTSNLNAPEGNIFIPSSATSRPTFSITPFLLNAFEINDQRKTNWTKTVVVNGQSYTYPFKYKIKSNANVTEANIIFRLSEQYLIRAESRANQNKLTGSNSAESDLNIIRSRSGLPNATATTLNQMMSAIEKERQAELFCEWGHRWYDLKRWGRANDVLGINKSPNWNATDALWPIPINEININVFLTQNPGY
jgi:hypothetical protein